MGFSSVEECDEYYKKLDIALKIGEREFDNLTYSEIVYWIKELSEYKLDNLVFEALALILVNHDLSIDAVQEQYGDEIKEKVCKMFSEAVELGIDVEKIFEEISEE